MKKATCRQLKGACEEIITGNTPEEMSENCKLHAVRMVQAGDAAHMQAMNDMVKMRPEDQQKWYEEFVSLFNSLEDK